MYIAPDKLLPMARFLNEDKPKSAARGGRGRGGGRGGRGGPGRGRGMSAGSNSMDSSDIDH